MYRPADGRSFLSPVSAGVLPIAHLDGIATVSQMVLRSAMPVEGVLPLTED
jgi:hypothetical protein